jgi:hypothetical protein
MEYIVYNMERQEVVAECIQNDMQWKISCTEYTAYRIWRVNKCVSLKMTARDDIIRWHKTAETIMCITIYT